MFINHYCWMSSFVHNHIKIEIYWGQLLISLDCMAESFVVRLVAAEVSIISTILFLLMIVSEQS